MGALNAVGIPDEVQGFLEKGTRDQVSSGQIVIRLVPVKSLSGQFGSNRYQANSGQFLIILVRVSGQFGSNPYQVNSGQFFMILDLLVRVSGQFGSNALSGQIVIRSEYKKNNKLGNSLSL